MSKKMPELDPTPLITQLVEKTAEGKLEWAPTADAKVFLVSVAGEMTFRISLVEAEDVDDWGNPITVQVPRLTMLDTKGKALWEVTEHDLKGPKPTLFGLYRMARRIANKVDERMGSAIEALEKL